MSTHTAEVSEPVSVGAAWVQRFLFPLLARRFPGRESITCLQLAADDADEAERLRESGHACEMIGSMKDSNVASASYDFIFTGRYPHLARELGSAAVLAGELQRILKTGGSVLLALGNRMCPLDLSRNGPLLHGPGSKMCLTLSEAEELFIKQAGFTSLVPVAVHGHFGWQSIPAVLRPMGHLLDFAWRTVLTPTNRSLYASPFNPTLLLWLNKDSIDSRNGN
jgi:hypothetical protein